MATGIADEVGIAGRLTPRTVITLPEGPGVGSALGDDIAIDPDDDVCVIESELLAEAAAFGVPLAAWATSTIATITATIAAATTAARRVVLPVGPAAAGSPGALDI